MSKKPDDAFGWVSCDVSSAIKRAVLDDDFDAVEGLRSDAGKFLGELVASYFQLESWEARNPIIHLTMDGDLEVTGEMMRDALSSPSAEVRLTALCCLDRSLEFMDFVQDDGVINAAKVHNAVSRFRIENRI